MSYLSPPPALRYFYVTLGLGTPRRNFSVIIDTGSTITYVPCKGCKHCGKHKASMSRRMIFSPKMNGRPQSSPKANGPARHVVSILFIARSRRLSTPSARTPYIPPPTVQDEPFDVQASSTAVELKCNSPLCNCGSPRCMCEENKCYYSRSYGGVGGSCAGAVLQCGVIWVGNG